MQERISGKIIESANVPFDSQELMELIGIKGIQITDFAGRSFNTVFFGRSDERGEVVLRFGEKPQSDFRALGIIGIETSGYFDPNKHDKEKSLTDLAISAGVPAPKIFETGLLPSGTSWSLQEKSKGKPIENVWSDLPESQKFEALYKIGLNLAKLHSYGLTINLGKIKGYWHDKLTAISNNLTALSLFDNDQISFLEGVLRKKIDTTLTKGPGWVSPVHLEYLLKHVFVDEQSNITGVIDWETGELQGDALCDLIFAAFWNTEEGTYEPSGLKFTKPNQFYAILNGYNQIAKVNKDTILELLPIYDAFWYLNIIWIRALQGNNEKTERRKVKVTKIVNMLSTGQL